MRQGEYGAPAADGKTRAPSPVQALPVDKLPLFLAVHQGVAEKGSTLADLQQKLEPLLSYVTHAGLWEGSNFAGAHGTVLLRLDGQPAADKRPDLVWPEKQENWLLFLG